MNQEERQDRLLSIHNQQQSQLSEMLRAANDELHVPHLADQISIHIKGSSESWKAALAAHGLQEIEYPVLNLTEFDAITEQIRLEPLPSIDEQVFAEWRYLDIPVMFLAGAAGAGLSGLLRETFADKHDEWGRMSADRGGHGGEIIDHVPGRGEPGGFGHRWQHGHDIANPFEIKWEEYFKGRDLPVMLPRAFYWIRHLIQDTFSKEGLPLPGHSLFRHWIEPLTRTKAGRETLMQLGTLKMRDVSGAALTNLIMGAYLWGTEKSLQRVVTVPNYRAFSLMAGANLVTLLVGVLLPPPATSLNWSTVPPILYYTSRLLWMMHKLSTALSKRQAILTDNMRELASFDAALIVGQELIGRRFRELGEFEAALSAYSEQASRDHEEVCRLLASPSIVERDVARMHELGAESAIQEETLATAPASSNMRKA